MLCPARRSAVVRADTAWTKPSQTAAASSSLRPDGLRARAPLSGTQTNSACAPNRPGLPPKTSSPTSNSLTAAPTAATSPASSMPRILRFGRRIPAKKRQMNGRAARIAQSVRVTVVAWTLTRTSSSAGTRPLDVLEPEHAGRPVAVVDDRSHDLTSHVGGGRRPLVLVFMTVTLPRGYGHVNQNLVTARVTTC